MCSLFSQGECIEARGASGSVDPVERLVALAETGTQDNEDADVFQYDNSDEDIGVRPRRTTHRHITSPVTYDRCSSFSPVGDDDEFDGYIDPLSASRGQMEMPVSVEGVSQITQVESQGRPQPEREPQPQPQSHRLGRLTHVFSRRPRPNRDRRPPRCGTGGHA
ncbi:hypothetical protein Acr_11g0003600 [Actinidia rufa]|uniref:Uncharacterized protein n=1 Tax=Actinidia rufa TaxID=165716 RepID=A0A7J0FBE2_9ERIC|nr:hypothetical protein Acr_11g0003600 [Actinidia rufa]